MQEDANCAAKAVRSEETAKNALCSAAGFTVLRLVFSHHQPIGISTQHI
jgi:hypothetical protein